MTQKALIKKLRKQFPKIDLIEIGEDYGWPKGSILIGAEMNPHMNYWDKNNNDTIFGIDKKFYDVCEKAGWWPEWNDAGTVLLFK